MQCPKCKARLQHFTGNSIQSANERHSGREAAAIEGLSCYNCGLWIEKPIVIEKEIPKESNYTKPTFIGSAKGMSSKEFGLANLESFRKYFNAVHALKQKGIGVKEIVIQLELTLSHSTMSRCYQLLCEEYGVEPVKGKNIRKISRNESADRKILAEEALHRKQHKLWGCNASKTKVPRPTTDALG